MFDRERDRLNDLVKNVLLLIIIATIFILFCFAFLQYNSIKDNNDSKHIINTFGKQRVYLQKINKDINYLYLLVDEQLTLEVRNENEIKAIIKDINFTETAFNDNLNSIINGSIIINNKKTNINRFIKDSHNNIKSVSVMWMDLLDNKNQLLYNFQEDIPDSGKLVNLIREINEESNHIYEKIEKVQNDIISNSIKLSKNKYFAIYILIIILALIIIVSGYQLRTVKQVILQLYDTTMIIENINNSYSFDESLRFIYDTFSTYVPYNYIGVALLDHKKENLSLQHGISDGSIVGLPEKLLGMMIPLRYTTLRRIVRTGEPRIINDLDEYFEAKAMSNYNEIIYGAGIRSSIALPLDIDGESVGIIFFSSNKPHAYKEEHVKFLNTIEDSIAISMRQKVFINDLLISSILGLAKMVEARDEDTGDHIFRMQKYTKLMAEKLYAAEKYRDEINGKFIADVEKFSTLHDIGKVRVRDNILLKPGKFTNDEFNEMKMHTVYGVDIIRALDNVTDKNGTKYFAMAEDIVGCHHERWDGTGYPLGKSQEDIPLSARIVAFADVLDALTSKRPYKKEFSFEEAYDYIVEQRGKAFDPTIVDIFVENKEEFCRSMT